MNPLSIDGLCDWVERAKPTPTQLQKRRVYTLIDGIRITPLSEINIKIIHTFKFKARPNKTLTVY